MPEPLAIRVKDAPALLGMDRGTFDREIRPHLNLIRISGKGRGFDRLELVEAWEHYKARNIIMTAKPWPVSEGVISLCPGGQPGSICVPGSGTSTSKSRDSGAFAGAVERRTGQKLKSV